MPSEASMPVPAKLLDVPPLDLRAAFGSRRTAMGSGQVEHVRRRMARREAIWRIVGIAVIASGSGLAIVELAAFDLRDVRAIVGATFVPIGLLVAGLAWHAARRPGVAGPARRAWILLGLSFVALAIGDGSAGLIALFTSATPAPAASDIVSLAFYPLAVAG